MPNTCVAYGCVNRGKIEGITYHGFPIDEERRQQWINAIKRKDWEPNKHSKICSAHFREADIDRTSLCRVRIREEAVPAIFKVYPEESQVKERRPIKRKQQKPCTSGTSFSTTKVLKSELSNVKTKLLTCKKQIKTLQQNKRRLQKKVARGKLTSETKPELNSSQETDINNLYLESSVSSKESILTDFMGQQILIKEEIQENEDEEENSAEHNEFMEEAVVQGDEREHDEESYLIKPVIKRQSSRQRKLVKLDNTLEEAISVLKNITSQSLQNEFVVFGQHIGVQLSKLPLETALVLQSDIQNLITKARLDSLQNPTSSTSREHT